MSARKMSYNEVLKNQSAALNPRLNAKPLLPKAPRVRLTEEAKANLRAIIDNKPTVMSKKPTNQVVNSYEEVPTLMAMTRPLVLAGASAGVLPSFCMDNRLFMQTSVNSAGVRLLKPNELVDTFVEGKKENPIDVCDSDYDEDTKGFGQLREIEMQPMDKVDELAKNSDFNPDVVASEGLEVFQTDTKPAASNVDEKKISELNTFLRVDATDSLIRAKRRMEHAFMDDYALKMKPYRRSDRPEYEGEYTFTVRVGVDDSNIVEVKDTRTTCRIKKVESEIDESEEEFKLDSDSESSSGIDSKRRRLNKNSHFFDPEKQVTKYNTRLLPSRIPIIEVNEKPSETKEYHWLAKYECVPSDSPFNSFLNACFRRRVNRVLSWGAEFEGVRYRFLRVGTNNRLNTVRLYKQFVIGNNFTIFRLGENGSPTVNLGMNARARERRFPQPINKKFTIASLFWANELLRSQKAW